MRTPRLATITIEQLTSVTGGREYTTDADLEDKYRAREKVVAWENQHPFRALICQNDRHCMR